MGQVDKSSVTHIEHMFGIEVVLYEIWHICLDFLPLLCSYYAPVLVANVLTCMTSYGKFVMESRQNLCVSVVEKPNWN